MELNLVEQVSAKVASLPFEQQQEALALVEALEKRTLNSVVLRSRRLKGATAGPGPKLTLADLKEARSEMWGEYVESKK
ncbi:MAG TPA: hypothetical protein PLD20_11630 [Blastocatellia bacterium]|nr:hypothetical protein [Blastocatellia bacterium]HMV83400.1 hypothetical protein [Blastocatellia bacterium]HMY74170.1 hypothetical protein [Blastocatellia bacterium]HMZ18574.1 hypothetical protein [Blastocatellia bacterium]HNG28125.1 hypothetical protein [Blastocatellia bacterium]